MKTPWRERTRDCVASARFFLCAILLFNIFVQTLQQQQQQQRGVKAKWDNRLVPTNSVYEQPRETDSQSAGDGGDNGDDGDLAQSANRSRDEDDPSRRERTSSSSEISSSSSSSSSAEEGEIIYDDDYEESDAPKEKSAKLTHDEPRDHSAPSISQEYYYYYDDYENATNPENEAAGKDDSLDYADSVEEAAGAAASSEKHRETLLPEAKPLETTSQPTPASSSSSPVVESSGDKRRSSGEETDDQDGQILIGEAVVSVVTTKSVVNGTFSVPVSPLPMTTAQMSAPEIPNSTPNPGLDYSVDYSVETGLDSSSSSSSSTFESGDVGETTEDSRIVASVQTSRSISGARFLPFLVVEGAEKNSSDDPRNSSEGSVDKYENAGVHFNDENDTIASGDAATATTTRKTSLPPESTESIIDKLDRVQSELSSGFLAGGFRTSGNTLQLDVLGEQRPHQTRKSYTTTSRTPVISKFVPRRYNQERKAVAPTSPTLSAPGKNSDVGSSDEEGAKNSTEKFKFRWPSASRSSRPTSTTTEAHSTAKSNVRPFGFNSPGKSTTPSAPVSVVGDISAFLPPGYKLKKEDAEVTEKSVLSDILAKSKIDISSLLPANYNPKTRSEDGSDEEEKPKIPVEKNLESLFAKPKVDISSLLPADFAEKKSKNGAEESPRVTATTEKVVKSLQDLFSKSSVDDISALLPPGYNRFKKDETVRTEKPTEASTEAPTVAMSPGTTARPAGGIKLVFPSRPGGRKAVHKAVTTTHSSRPEAGGSGGAVSPKIQKGWPVRATTEFTGWPTPSTTPISIEKLLEAARTATVASTNISLVPTTSTSSTTSTSTTTTTTQRPTTPGICEEECEVAGTIRIVGNATWVPELLDRNTQEWQLLAEEIEKEMNLVFVKSSVLKKWYKRVRIDAFSPGSILVDYFIELADLNQRINTQELKVIFHDSLRTYNSDKWNETRTKGPIRLGAFALDPKSTDFVVIPKISLPQHIEADDRLVPQWAIAVIIIGVGGLLFIIIFGVSVLVNRQRAAKLKPSQAVYSEEVAKNMIQASHGAPSHRSSQDYPKSEISTIWNDTTVWRDKSFESNSNEVLVDGTLGHERHMERHHPEDRKYNMYDSWRSEWNGYYYNTSHNSSKFAGYESATNLSRHPPDYDTNF